ncbi:hypothetical protein F4778DRAFT_750606 [Xylariomycetidae sp. FL2044]|nr:hypothetical protein F4778DRAFT_750606 [Xylariomycetidae sp. FL2044]
MRTMTDIYQRGVSVFVIHLFSFVIHQGRGGKESKRFMAAFYYTPFFFFFLTLFFGTREGFISKRENRHGVFRKKRTRRKMVKWNKG